MSRQLTKLRAVPVVVAVVVLVATFGYWSELFKSLLKWIDYLAPSPGLSGLLLLGMLPLGFVLLCVLAEWLLAVRKKQRSGD